MVFLWCECYWTSCNNCTKCNLLYMAPYTYTKYMQFCATMLQLDYNTLMLLKCKYIITKGKNIMLMWLLIHLSWMKFVNVHYNPFAIEQSFWAKKLKQIFSNSLTIHMCEFEYLFATKTMKFCYITTSGQLIYFHYNTM
jgi:hypothetical protein